MVNMWLGMTFTSFCFFYFITWPRRTAKENGKKKQKVPKYWVHAPWENSWLSFSRNSGPPLKPTFTPVAGSIFHGLVVPFGTSGMVQVDRHFVLVPLVPRRSEDPLLLIPLVPLRSEDPFLLVPLVPRLQPVPTCPIWLNHLSFANSLFSDFVLGFSVSFYFSKNTFECKVFLKVLSCWRRYKWQPNLW